MMIILAIFLINISFILKVKAETIKNDCNDNSADCAFCVYQIGSTDGCYLNFSVTYKSDSTPLNYQLLSKKDNYTKGGIGISFKYNYKIFNKDAFLAGNDIRCPKLNSSLSTKSFGTRNFEYNYNFELSENGNIQATNDSEIKKKTENNPSTPSEKEESISYRYKVCGGFTIRIINGTAKIDKDNSSDDFTIGGNIDATLFKKNTCPIIYYQSYNSHGYQGCNITTTETNGYSKADCYFKDENTGGNVTEQNPDLNAELPNDIENCNSLLGEPDEPGSPAYYLVKAFHVIKYVALILLLVLSVMDFTNAIAKQDKDAMSKVLKKLMMRFILCIIIFLLPYLISLLLKYLVEVQTDLCGVK